jgi:hypothetical protein
MYGYGLNGIHGYKPFAPATDIEGVGLYLNKNTLRDGTGNAVSSWVDQSTNAYNFVQATGIKQPLQQAGTVDFDGTDDALTVLVSQPLNDSSGIFFFSGIYDSSQDNHIFSSCDNASSSNLFLIYISGGTIRIYNRSSGVTNLCRSTNIISNGAYYYGYIKSNGSTWTINLNGVDEVVVVSSGSNDGSWLDTVLNRDALNVGAWLYSSSVYGKAKISGLLYTNDDTIDTEPPLTFFSNPNNFV